MSNYNRYRLELHWDSIVYNSYSTALLKGAYFSGPALKSAQKIQAPDSIDLDLTRQHLVLFDSYYVVRLSWTGVEYKSDGTVVLVEATMENDVLKSLHKLASDDFIVVDTKKHEEATHAYNLVYESTVVRSDSKPHEYTR